METGLRAYRVWDAGVRWFHWVNALAVIALAGVGFTIMNADELGVSEAGEVTLITVHVWIAYVFVLNLLWRVVWAFVGGPFARWRALLPLGPG